MEILNQYLSVGAEAVVAKDGALDKFMGDAVAAFFNAPLPQEDDVLRALRTALRIQEQARDLHRRQPAAYHVEYGIGINLGEAVVGNVGTEQRLDYTAIGQCVNLARRLQEAAKPGQILISEAVHQRASHAIKAHPLPPLHIDGMGTPIVPDELLGLRTRHAARTESPVHP